MSNSNAVVTHTIRTNEAWLCKTLNGGSAARPVVVTKATVRVAKGQAGGGRFQGATNLRGTASNPVTVAVTGVPGIVRAA